MERLSPVRIIDVAVEVEEKDGGFFFKATTQEGISITYALQQTPEFARNTETALEGIRRQLGKTTDHFSFTVTKINVKNAPFFPASALNGIRREMATMLAHQIKKVTDAAREEAAQAFVKRKNGASPIEVSPELTYLANCSNSLSRELYASLGANSINPAYELEPAQDAELMRTKYCIKYELGLCPNYKTRWAEDKGYRNNIGKEQYKEPFYLLNGKNRLQLKFDCANCEMLVIG